jgi:hypothetical protein
MFAGHYGAALIVHRSDMPLVGDSAKAGLDLWSSAPATFVVELLIVAAGLALYLRATEATSAFGRFAPWALALILVATLYPTVFGESSADVDGAATAGLLSTAVIFPALAWLVELRRRARPLAVRGVRVPGAVLGGGGPSR